jgi:NAD(P)-dependent dehydrogenase (short-subunit alcohol dehydrogenase family)
MSPIDIAPYGIAKSGVIGLTRSMVLKLADYGIIANAIAPGPIDTEIVRAAWTKEAFEERANHLRFAALAERRDRPRRTVPDRTRLGLHFRSNPGGRRRNGSRPVPTWSKSIAADCVGLPS